MAEGTKGTNVTETAGSAAENGSTGAYGGDPEKAVNGENREKAVSTNESAEKTFTQAELDKIVKDRLDRAAKGQPSKEELKAFREWQESQKSEEQKAAEKISAAEAAKAEAEKKLAASEAKVCALSKGVTAEAVDDVIALALGKVSDEVDISAAIGAVIAKYPSFCAKAVPEGDEKPAGITTGMALGQGSGGKPVDGVTALFMQKNPGIKI